MGADAIWITEAEVVQLMELKEAIVALEAALREEARGLLLPTAIFARWCRD